MSDYYRYGLVQYRPTQTSDGLEDTVRAYLPRNYEVVGHTSLGLVIRGKDVGGWTMHEYVQPRLGSGLMRCDEIDLSHPAMKEMPA